MSVFAATSWSGLVEILTTQQVVKCVFAAQFHELGSLLLHRASQVVAYPGGTRQQLRPFQDIFSRDIGRVLL